MPSIASNKLARANIERLISGTVLVEENGQVVEKTNTESANDIQLYLELSKIQDCLGKIDGIHYSDFIKLLDCSKATFYNSIYRLSNLGYITADHDNRGNWSIVILNNIFVRNDDLKKGYIRTNVDFLYTNGFKKLSCIEKRICLYLYMNQKSDQKTERYLKTIADAVGVKVLSVISDALLKVKKFFDFATTKTKMGKKFIFKYAIITKNIATEASNYIKHKLRQLCRKDKIDYTEENIIDVATVSSQYSHSIDYTTFVGILNHVIYRGNKKILDPSYINAICNLESNRIKAKGNNLLDRVT